MLTVRRYLQSDVISTWSEPIILPNRIGFIPSLDAKLPLVCKTCGCHLSWIVCLIQFILPKVCILTFSWFFVCFCRRIPYLVALKHKHRQCAALLNPTSAEPMVWPSPLKFISELNQDAKILLEKALMEINREREKSILKGVAYSSPSPSQSDAGSDDDISEVKF